jgi:hypothetical protein
VVVGAIAAFLGGGVWAAVVILANLELGWAAWGIGALVGASMAKVTTARGQTIGLIAALLAAAGLIAGKTLTVTVGTRPGLAKDIRSDSLWIAEAAAYQLRSSKTFPAPVQSQLDQMAESDTLPDALWSDMVAAGRAHVAGLDDAGRDRLAGAYADTLLSRTSTTALFRSQISMWDLLWFGLAIATAWKIMSRPKAVEAPAKAPANT